MPKVAIARCQDYEKQRVYAAVKRAVEFVGGIDEFVRPGMKVLLKPNLLSPRPPADAVDTHPEVVRALVRLVREAGAAPVIGDAPGGYGKNIEEVFEVSGMKKMAEEEGVELLKFTSPRFVDGIPISRHLFECDAFISVPKLKTHSITVMTAGIKNSFGTVVGLYKASCHSLAPKQEDFAKVIAKVYSVCRPCLIVLDAVLAMEGDGPSTGDIRKMNFIMASRDAVAMDSCAAKLIGLEPLEVLITKEAYEMGLGEADLSRIELVGDKFDDFMAIGFKLPRTIAALRMVPRAMANAVGRLINFKPFIDKGICTRCNLCKVSCPVACITIADDRCAIDYRRCVRCMCCHEVCPYRAISIKRNVLTKMLWG